MIQAAFDLLASCTRPFLIVGGHALAAYGLVRQTIDVDCLIAVDDQAALETTLTHGGYVAKARTENFVRYTGGSDRPEIDVLLVDGPTFQKLAETAGPLHRGQHTFRVPGLAELIALKLHAIRNDPRRETRDLGDIAELLRLNPGRITAEALESLCLKFGSPEIAAKLKGTV
jgi:hypothetical protein